MSITQQLQAILEARYGRDVRQAIHDSIEEGYNIAVQAEGKAVTAEDSASASASAAAQSSAIALQAAQLAEQYKNEAFSGTPTGYEALVEKVNSIYKETASDFAIIGTSEGSALARTIYGMSVQDSTPTPSVPVEIQSAKADFKCVGKNLIPYPYYRQSGYSSQGMTGTYGDDGVITINKEVGSATAYFGLYFGYKMLTPNTRYKLSMSLENANNVSVYISVNNIDIAAIRNKASGNYEYTFTTPNELLGTTKMDIYFGAADVETNCKVKVMLTLEDADQTYELYKHTDVTTDLTLRAIEVASTDNYNLVKNGKYYIADTVDWSEDRGYEITRRIKEITINSGDMTTTSNPRYGIVLNTVFNKNEFSVRQAVKNNLLLSAFVSSTYENFVSESGNGLAFFDGSNLRLRDDSMASTADWSTYLQSNPVKVIGILVNPTTESITSEQAQALLSLKTYDEATSISATGDIEPSVDLEYSKDRNTALALTGHNLAHKNALKLNDINTALIELGGN